MNVIDLIVIVIIGVFGFLAFRKGFIRACFSFLPMVISLAASYKLNPMLGKYIRSTPLFFNFKDKIFNSLNLNQIIAEKTLATQTEIINSMNLPQFLKSSLIENNNPVIYNILDVGELQDYIAGFIANICVNIACVVIIFLIVFIISKIILSALDIISKLPVINSFNKISGLMIGFIQGLVVVWILGIAITFFYYKPFMQEFISLLNSSTIAIQLYENNFLLFMILKIFM